MPAFNECVEKSLNDLKPFANGTSMIPLKKRIMEFSGNVISKVYTCCVYRVCNLQEESY